MSEHRTDSPTSPPAHAPTCLVIGGTGSLGRAVVRRLVAAGHGVRVMTRTPAKAAGLAAHGVEVVQGTLLDRASVERACAGVHRVVAAAHSIFGRGREASVHVDLRGHKNLIDIAKAAGGQHFVYTSVCDYGGMFRAVPFFRMKLAVEDHLRASGLRHTILRPTAFMESHAHALIGVPVLRKGRVVVFGRGETPRNFVAADDVAQFAVRALQDATFAGETLEIAGPENLTTMEVVEVYERLAGQRARVTHVPLGVLKTASRLLRPVHPGVSQILQAAVLGETIEQRFDGTALAERFSIQLRRLADWAAEASGVVAATPPPPARGH